MRAFALSLVFLSAAASAAAEPRQIAGFDQVNVAGRYRAEIAIGERYDVTVDGPDASRIRTRVDGDTLRIEPVSRAWFGDPAYRVRVRVVLPRLAGVSAERGAQVAAAAGGPCADFSAASAMGAELQVSGLQCGSIDAAAAMGATLRLSGSCASLDVAAAMGGSVDAAALRCDRVDASAAMGGAIDARAAVSYDAAATMGGAISIAGEARAGDQSAILGGQVTHRD